MAQMFVSIKDSELFKQLADGITKIMKDERIPLDIREEHLRELMPILGLEYEE